MNRNRTKKLNGSAENDIFNQIIIIITILRKVIIVSSLITRSVMGSAT